jgi:hypothetical protein
VTPGTTGPAGDLSATPPARASRSVDFLLAALAFACFASHAAAHIAEGHPYDVLWVCTVSSLLIGAANLARSAQLNAIGLLWLTLGVPLWLIDMASSHQWMPTSFVTHTAGPVLGLVTAWRLGFPRRSWWKALAAHVALQQFTHLTTPPDRNINVAFAVHPTALPLTTSYPLYWSVMLVICGLVYWTGERLVLAGLTRASQNSPTKLKRGPKKTSVEPKSIE